MRTGTYGRADLHVHTLWSDGAQRPEEVVAVASERVDVVAITDHDEIRGALRAREWAREHPELGVDVVVGEEISTLNGHLLGLFLEECIPPGLSALDTIGEIHAQGGLAVATSLPSDPRRQPRPRLDRADDPRSAAGRDRGRQQRGGLLGSVQRVGGAAQPGADAAGHRW